MATFYYDSFSTDNIYSQWTKHLQTQSYIKDIDGIISKNKQELQLTIQSASAEQKDVIQKVCGNLEDGFGLISSHLNDIKYELGELRSEISAMSSMLDWKLSMLIEEQRLTNQLLGNIAQLLRIPDSQKQRVYHIEQGLKYFKNAIIEGISSSFYDDAIESFKEAERIERKDFITLNRIGQIFLFSEKHMNIPLSEEYFLKSAREAFAEANVGGTTTSNNLSPSGYNSIQSSQDYFKSATAEAYLYASRTCYLQQKLTDAIKYSEKAYVLIPDFIEAGFEQAKYLAANDQIEECVKVLETVIKKDRYYSVKTLSDRDLTSKHLVLKLLKNFKEGTILTAQNRYQKCQSIISTNSKAKEVLDIIGHQINKNNYLAGMYALDLLDKDYQIPYPNYSIGGTNIRNTIINRPIKIIDLINNENKSANDLEALKEELKNIFIKDNASTGMFLGGAIGFVVGFFRGCTISTFSMDVGTWFITIILSAVICAGIGAFSGYIKLIEVREY
ncbi:MAG: hypothetical protein IPH62_00110 [Ignavibacteriae bacterium]|nr:hypothetical protein [Ignavibacteriota bacterium]